MLLVDNLQPFTKYGLEAAGVNQYTTTLFHIYGPVLRVYTLEGGACVAIFWSCDFVM